MNTSVIRAAIGELQQCSTSAHELARSLSLFLQGGGAVEASPATPEAVVATGRRPQAPTPEAGAAKPKAAAGSYDDPAVRLVAAHPGLLLTEIVKKLKAEVGTMHGVLRRLVAQGRIVREGGGYHPAEVAE